MTSRFYIGGIEGGATHTSIILMRDDGTVVAEAEGPSSNHWLIGLDECLKRLSNLITEAKKKAGLDDSVQLKSLGLCLSGGDDEESRRKIQEGLLSTYPNTSLSCHVVCDTMGAIGTACEKGGVVLIAGTGSNCEVLNPDLTSHRCGGWGHLIGDEASGYWITNYCLKQYFDTVDNFAPSDHDVSFVKKAMVEYFKLDPNDAQMGLLEHLYSKFDKSFFAGLCKELARGASEVKDPLCQEAFTKAGRLLGRHIVALSPKIDKSLFACDGGLHVVCVGSVWKSWPLLKTGFIEGLQPKYKHDLKIEEITLMGLKKGASYGAAYLGAKHAEISLPINYAENSDVFFNHKF